jgi:hypothetical protein
MLRNIIAFNRRQVYRCLEYAMGELLLQLLTTGCKRLAFYTSNNIATNSFGLLKNGE